MDQDIQKLKELQELLTFVNDKNAKASILKEIAFNRRDDKDIIPLDHIFWLTQCAFLQVAYYMLDIYSEAISQSFTN